MEFLSYLFWPNPGLVSYENPKVIGLLVLCFAFVSASVCLRLWRRKVQNPVLRKLSRSWPRSTLWFGITGLFLVLSRTEGVSYVSMRFLWIVWGLMLLLYVLFQFRIMRLRYYEPMPAERSNDPREKYLPKSGRRK